MITKIIKKGVDYEPQNAKEIGYKERIVIYYFFKVPIYKIKIRAYKEARLRVHL